MTASLKAVDGAADLPSLMAELAIRARAAAPRTPLTRIGRLGPAGRPDPPYYDCGVVP